jgi:PAS domain S-box-containing protein
MKLNNEHKVIASSLVAGLLLWFVDAVLDAFVFKRSMFPASLFDLSAQELYFRCFIFLGLLLFGFVISRMLAKNREAEERYRNIIELSSDIIYTCDKDGRLVFMNDAAFRILEYAPDEIVGRPLTEIFHHEDREKTFEKRMEMTRTGVDAVNFENRCVTRSGRPITVLHNVRPLRDGKGAFIGMQGIARDITLRKMVEEELKRAVAKIADEKARSESILAAIGDGINIIDHDYRVIYQNHVHKEMVGGDKTGQYCYQAFSGRDSICPGCPITASFKDNGIHVMEKTGVENGKTWTREIKAAPLMDLTGRTVAGIETVRDITDRKKAGERLKLFSEAIEEAMDGIQIVDLDGSIIYSNKAVQAIYGFTPDELSGKNVSEMNADREFAGRVIFPSIRTTGKWNGELMVVHKDGRTFPIWLSTALVKDERGMPIAMVGIIRDITESKQVEEIMNRHREQLIKLVEARTEEITKTNEQLRKEIADRELVEDELLNAQKLESVGILAGGIAHDFNNLLASILGNIGLAMLDVDHDHRAFKRLVSAEKASLRAQDLTQQLLTFSKGGVPVKNTADIRELVKESASFALRGSRVNYQFSFDGNLRLVDVDEGQMSQVIHNLVINADHAMPEGGTIAIRCSNVADGVPDILPSLEHGYVRVSVEDHGIGIPKEHLTKIFDPYFTTKQKGSGLGLATTYSIVKKHGGHIAVESEQGRGTTFHVYLPALLQTKPYKKAEEGSPSPGAGAILVMDDDAEVRETTGNVLRRLGYDVELTGDGREAVERYRQARDEGRVYDLVIMDLTVPGGMGGKEALKKLREMDPDVKAIVSSGYSNDPIMADFKTYGFNGVVTKPYRVKELSEEVQRVINGRA